MQLKSYDTVSEAINEMIVFAISSKDKKIKGTVVNAYGIYSGNKASGIIEHLKSHL